jgi:hypothetical protein
MRPRACYPNNRRYIVESLLLFFQSSSVALLCLCLQLIYCFYSMGYLWISIVDMKKEGTGPTITTHVCISSQIKM